MYMFNQMPKNATPQTSAKDLATNTAKLDEIKYQNELSKQNIKKVENEKLLDDTEALKENAKIVNALGKHLVWLFFGKWQIKNFKIYFIFFWIVAYAGLNIYFYECLKDKKADFYISLVNNIGLFIIICILGKFLKDSISSIIEIFKK